VNWRSWGLGSFEFLVLSVELADCNVLRVGNVSTGGQYTKYKSNLPPTQNSALKTLLSIRFAVITPISYTESE
jgi:hypothetical protein